MAIGNLQAVFELVELGEALHRQRLRREQPELSESVLDALVDEWRRARPGAPHGDADGRPGNRFASGS